MARIRALYDVEARARDLDATARAALRQQEAQPLLDALADWMERERVHAIPRTPLAESITYATNTWESLTQYVRNGRLAIDNNAAERAIKPFAIGRKN